MATNKLNLGEHDEEDSRSEINIVVENNRTNPKLIASAPHYQEVPDRSSWKYKYLLNSHKMSQSVGY